MSHHVTSADIAIHGDHLDNSKVAKAKTIALGIAGIGTILSLLGLFGVFGEWFQGTYAYSWLFAFYFFLTLSIGGVFWTSSTTSRTPAGAPLSAAPSKTSAPPSRGSSSSASPCSSRR